LQGFVAAYSKISINQMLFRVAGFGTHFALTLCGKPFAEKSGFPKSVIDTPTLSPDFYKSAPASPRAVLFESFTGIFKGL
jgi:hypothetical protein